MNYIIYSIAITLPNDYDEYCLPNILELWQLTYILLVSS